MSVFLISATLIAMWPIMIAIARKLNPRPPASRVPFAVFRLRDFDFMQDHPIQWFAERFVEYGIVIVVGMTLFLIFSFSYYILYG